MRPRLPLLLAVLALAVPAAGLAVSNPAVLTGTFQKQIRGKAAPLNGTWKLTLKANGTFEIARNGIVVVRGVASGVAGRLSILDRSGQYRCTGKQRAASYMYKLKGSTLTLRPVLESCAGRRLILSTGSFTKR